MLAKLRIENSFEVRKEKETEGLKLRLWAIADFPYSMFKSGPNLGFREDMK